jgi:hypothetical protein
VDEVQAVSGELLRVDKLSMQISIVTFWLAGCRNNNSPEAGRRRSIYLAADSLPAEFITAIVVASL